MWFMYKKKQKKTEVSGAWMKILYSSYVWQREKDNFFWVEFCRDKRTSCKEAAAVHHRPERLFVLRREDGGACGWLNQASRLLLKHIDCIFIFHFQLLRRQKSPKCDIIVYALLLWHNGAENIQAVSISTRNCSEHIGLFLQTHTQTHGREHVN